MKKLTCGGIVLQAVAVAVVSLYRVCGPSTHLSEIQIENIEALAGEESYNGVQIVVWHEATDEYAECVSCAGTGRLVCELPR